MGGTEARGQGSLEVEVVLSSQAELGEGPSWDSQRNELIWLDIMRQQVHRFDPSAGRDSYTEVDQPVGAIVRRVGNDQLIAAARDGFGLVEWGKREVEIICEVERDIGDNRMNDGKCDRAGRFWAGTMGVDGNASGALYRLDRDRSVSKIISDVAISNGLAWSPDNRRMYYIDTPTRRLDVLDFDFEAGTVANRRALKEFPASWGTPDGMTSDVDGGLWVAFWGGWCVRRLDDGGEVTDVVELPVSQVTSCTFGGNDGRDLFITSARYKLTGPQLQREPLAGALFRLRPPVGGLPDPAFAG
jgi:sugar lactone lactonase YvrE